MRLTLPTRLNISSDRRPSFRNHCYSQIKYFCSERQTNPVQYLCRMFLLRLHNMWRYLRCSPFHHQAKSRVALFVYLGSVTGQPTWVRVQPSNDIGPLERRCQAGRMIKIMIHKALPTWPSAVSALNSARVFWLFGRPCESSPSQLLVPPDIIQQDPPIKCCATRPMLICFTYRSGIKTCHSG